MNKGLVRRVILYFNARSLESLTKDYATVMGIREFEEALNPVFAVITTLTLINTSHLFAAVLNVMVSLGEMDPSMGRGDYRSHSGSQCGASQ